METYNDLLNYINDIIDDVRQTGEFAEFNIFDIREVAKSIDLSDQEYDIIDEKLEELFLLYMSNWDKVKKIVCEE